MCLSLYHECDLEPVTDRIWDRSVLVWLVRRKSVLKILMQIFCQVPKLNSALWLHLTHRQEGSQLFCLSHTHKKVFLFNITLSENT